MKVRGRTLPVSLVELYPAADRLLHQLVGVVAPERRVPAEQNKGDDSAQKMEREEVDQQGRMKRREGGKDTHPSDQRSTGLP